MSRREETDPKTETGVRLDLVLLTAVVVLSLLSYIGALGFYSDDWAVLASLQKGRGLGFLGDLALGMREQEMFMRPAQALYVTGLYWAFGLNPLPYHLVNGLVLVLMAVACLMALRELKAPPAMALATAMLFVLLPTYSTDRMWYVSFQIPACMACWFFSLYAALRARRGSRATWETLSIVSAALSLLFYEVSLPLIVFQAAALVAWRFHERPPRSWGWIAASAPQVICVFVAACIVVYKSQVTTRGGSLSGYGYLIRRLFKLDFEFESQTDYGLNLLAVLRSNFLNWSPADVAKSAALVGPVGLGVAAAIAVLAWLALRRRTWPWGVRGSLLLALAGLFMMYLGYGVFLLTDNLQWTRAGMGNRTHIAAAFGLAMVVIGLLGALAASLPARMRRDGFAVPVALLCAACSLIVSAIGERWGEASRAQHVLLDAFKRDVGGYAPEQSVLLGGVCTSVGPAPVFDAWDWPGALSVMTGKPLPKGDVIQAWERFEPDAVVAIVYSQPTRYAYGPNLILYDPRLKRAVRLTDRQAAAAYLAEAPPPACPRVGDGLGAPLF